MKTASINLSKIDKTKIITGKNGDKYLNIVIWDNGQRDSYGNDFAIQQSQSKEEREAKVKPIYLGNGKDWDKKDTQPKPDTMPNGNSVDSIVDIPNGIDEDMKKYEDENGNLPF